MAYAHQETELAAAAAAAACFRAVDASAKLSVLVSPISALRREKTLPVGETSLIDLHVARKNAPYRVLYYNAIFWARFLLLNAVHSSLTWTPLWTSLCLLLWQTVGVLRQVSTTSQLCARRFSC